jgi:hypothetical protein
MISKNTSYGSTMNKERQEDGTKDCTVRAQNGLATDLSLETYQKVSIFRLTF